MRRLQVRDQARHLFDGGLSERLELEARRLAALTGDGPAASAARKQIVNDVATLRHGGEMKSYIDLLFLTLIVVLCISKIVTN